MKKLCVLAVMALGLLVPAVALPATAGAVNVFQACSNGAASTDVCKQQAASTGNPFLNVIKVVLDILSIIVGVAALVMVVFSGLKMIWAQGDPQAVKSAREGIIGAIVGLVVAALAQAIVVFVLNKIK